MSAILKSGSASLQRVHPFGAHVPAPDPPPPDPELERLRAALAAAEMALAMQEETIAGVPGRIDAAFAEGEAKGRAEAEDRAAARLALLRDVADGALVRFGEEMAAMERLAALLAQTCLDRMLIGSQERAQIVLDMIRGRVAELESDAVMRIQVSTEDFPDAAAIAAVAPAGCEIDASPTLGPGGCTVKLRLGALDVGIDQQWGTLRAALGEMAA